MTETPFREAVVSLDAVRHNLGVLRERVSPAAIMVVVKANAYGHGAVAIARTAVAEGADWLGVADIGEALELRAAAIEAPVLAWLHGPDAAWGEAIAARVDLGVSSLGQLQGIADAARASGQRAAVQLKLDTGLSRNGIAAAEWATIFDAARALEHEGVVLVRGVFSHLSNASPEDDRAAIAEFDRGVALATAAGLAPELLHIAATAAALNLPEARYNLVRIGIGAYGLPPCDNGPSAVLGLRPAMTLRGRVAATRRIALGAGVSYDYSWRAGRATTVALVPLGYADGIPRAASGTAEVSIAGRRHPIVGRIAMDQFVVDVGDESVAVGDEVVLFGDPERGEPGAGEWADAAGTINYEIVTRIGHRVPRSYEGE